MRVALFRDDTPLGHRVAAWLAASGVNTVSVIPADVAVDEQAVGMVHRPARASDLRGLVAPLLADPPDLLVVATFPWKLPMDLVAVAPRAFNLHSALLPELRGAHPEYWAIRRGFATTGVTAHALTETFDAGPMFLQRAMPIHSEETLGSLCDRLAALGLEVLKEMLNLPRPWTATPQPAAGSLAPRVCDADLRLDPREDSATMWRHWRACTPYLVPWLDASGRRLPVASLSPTLRTVAGPPGVWSDAGFWYVRCADERVFEVIVAGGAAHG